MTQIAVIDYGMGNLHSVSKALEAVSQKESIVITSDQEVITVSYTHLTLPTKRIV